MLHAATLFSDERQRERCTELMPSSSPYSTGTGPLHFRRTIAKAAASGRRDLTGSTLAVAEGPSCLFVGPIETASKERLEALYRQARDSYYSGKPLIVDDMFDKVELKLRLYGSKCVVKYPRCSIRGHMTYADAEEDQSLVFALVIIWLLLFTFGTSAFLIPAAYSIKSSLRDAFTSIFVLEQWKLHTASNTLLVGIGYLIGYPIASASVKALQGLWTNDLVALKGFCPNCGEEVFAFVKTNDKSRQSPHRAECHVCQCCLEFRTKVEVCYAFVNKQKFGYSCKTHRVPLQDLIISIEKEYSNCRALFKNEDKKKEENEERESN